LSERIADSLYQIQMAPAFEQLILKGGERTVPGSRSVSVYVLRQPSAATEGLLPQMARPSHG